MRNNNNKGFSLLELLIVVAIILIIATIAIPSLLRSRQAANESGAIATLRTINTAEVTYSGSNQGQVSTLAGLVTAGLLDSRFSGTAVGGYSYAVTVDTTGTIYTSTATPVSTNTGRYGYYSENDAVIHYSTTTTLAPSGMAGNPVQ